MNKEKTKKIQLVSKSKIVCRENNERKDVKNIFYAERKP